MSEPNADTSHTGSTSPLVDEPQKSKDGGIVDKTKKQVKQQAERLGHMAREQAEELSHKAVDYGKEAAGHLGEQLKEHWHQVRANAPEFMYPSVQSAAAANEQRTEANLAYYRENNVEISSRLRDLDDEWHVDRVLQVVASGVTLAGFWFSLSRTKLWLLVPLVVAGGALVHGLTGQSPAVDLARRLGFRTRDEIEAERRQLLALQDV